MGDPRIRGRASGRCASHRTLDQTGNGADRDKILGFLGGFVEQAKAAHLFDDAYPVPSFTDWTAEQLKAYGTALKLVVQHATAADPTPLAEVRDRLTAALPQPSAPEVAS